MANTEISDIVYLIKKLTERIGKNSSVEDFFQALDLGEFSVKVLNIDKDELACIAEELIKQFPQEAKKAMEFVVRQVIPALLSKLPLKDSMEVIRKFLKESLFQIINTGTIGGKHFIHLLSDCSAVTEVCKHAAKEVVTQKVAEQAFISGEAVKMEIVLSNRTELLKNNYSGHSIELPKSETKAVAKVGIGKAAAKAGATAASTSTVLGVPFLWHDLNEMKKQNERNEITDQEYKKRWNGRIGEYAGNVIGSGVVGAGLYFAALTGPPGWLAFGAGVGVSYGVSYGVEKLGDYIGRNLAD